MSEGKVGKGLSIWNRVTRALIGPAGWATEMDIKARKINPGAERITPLFVPKIKQFKQKERTRGLPRLDIKRGTCENRPFVLFGTILMKTRWTLPFVLSALALTSGAVAAMPQEVRIDKAVNSPALTVRYSKMRVAMVELKINGRSMSTRSITSTADNGEVNFSIDLDTLEPGENKVEVLLFDAAGKQVGSQNTTMFAEQDKDQAVYLQGLKAGETVRGSVEIKLGVNRDFREMYVSFFIDDAWKSIKNYPPYSYFWDTSRFSNGWHEIQAWVVDEANNTFKTRKVRVFVNNPSGRTERVNSATTSTTMPKVTPKPAVKPVVKPVVKPAVKPVVKAAPKATVKPVPSVKPAVTATPVVSTPKAATVGAVAINTVAAAPGKASGLSQLPAVEGGVSTDQKLMTPTGKRVVEPKAPIVKPTPKVTPPVTKAVQASNTLRIGMGTRLPNISQYNILLNGRAVQFDVAPSVEEGIPLTPFRHLFEQAGGKVGWVHADKRVIAAGSGREIELTIGMAQAIVNGRVVTLEKASKIVRNRAIVPLSFMSSALNVNIDYDPKTQRVLVTNKK